MSEVLHIYTRVSSTVQEEKGSSLESQKEFGIKKSKELGFDHKVWNEGGQSSFHDDLENRPVLVELLSLISEGRVKHLFVYNTDRLSRNDHTWSMIRIKLIQNDVTLYTNEGKYLLSDPMNKLLLGIMSEISSYDNYLRAERSRLGKVNKIQKGNWMGGPPPYGYRIENKRLVENPDESKWVKFIYESYRDHKSTRWIKQELLKNGVSTRRNKPVWSLGSIEKLITNTHYSGFYNYTDKKSGKTYRVDCPSILPSTLIKEVQDVKDSKSRKRNMRKSNFVHFYLLREYLICGSCGSHMSARTYPDNEKSYYYCPRRERNFVNEGTEKVKECSNNRYIKIEKTDQLVWDTIVEILSKSHLFKEEIKTQVMSQSKPHSEQSKDIKKLKRKLKLKENEIEETTNTIVTLETDRILNRRDNEELEKILSNVENVRNGLRSEREEMIDQIHHLETQGRWINWVGHFGDRISKMSDFTLEEKKHFLDGVIERITVNTIDVRNHELKIEFKYPYVDDKFQWRDQTDKSLGYEIENGKRDITVLFETIKKK
jgi:DNA invertase Pin-like site-specific DNA recombinase